MPASTTLHPIPAGFVSRFPTLPECDNCGGTGWDPAFGCSCNCSLLHSGPSARLAAARAAIGEVPTPTAPRGGGQTSGRSTGNRFANQYPGTCVDCGGHVAAGEGLRVRDGQAWATKHTACPARPAQAAVQAEERTNRFAGECGTCGRTVAAEAGIIRKVDGRWVPFHRTGDCPQVEVEVAAPTAASLDLRQFPRTGDSVLVGVPGSDSRLKVRIDFPAEGQWAGWVFVKDGAEYGRGRRYGKQAPGQSYRGDIQDELRAILADPQEAFAKYGRLTDHCGVCGRKLEHEDSVARGIGPWCAQRLGW